MTRRVVDPLAPLKPVARLAAVGVVALGGVLAATQLYPAGAAVRPGTAAAHLASPADVLHSVAVPPGSTALHGKPADAPGGGQPPFTSGGTVQRTGAVWWSTELSSADVYSWFRAHPPTGMTAQMSGTVGGAPGQTQFLGFTPVHVAASAPDPTVYVETFPLPGGRTGIQLSADVVYPLVRTAQEMVPTAAKLVVTGQYSGGGIGTPPSPVTVTLTDPARIASITKIVNSMQLVNGIFNCPQDAGGGLLLTFETASGKTLATTDMSIGGCGFASLRIGSVREPALSGAPGAIQQIQSVLGTHWNLANDKPR